MSRIAAVLCLVLAGTWLPMPALQTLGTPQAIARFGDCCHTLLGRDYIASGSFSVPAGKIFMLTGIASSTSPQFTPLTLHINGVLMFSVRLYDSGLQAMDAPKGLFAAAGDQVAVGGGYAHGNLVNASLRQYVLCEPPPSALIQLQSSYVVPAGKAVLITAFGNTNATNLVSSSTEYLNINGQPRLWHSTAQSTDRWRSTVGVPHGLIAGPGDTISFSVTPSPSGALTPVAWGYLIDF